jgi:hypothetical protein
MNLLIIHCIFLQLISALEPIHRCAAENCYDTNNTCIDYSNVGCNYLDHCTYIIKSGATCGNEMTCIYDGPNDGKCINIYESEYGCGFISNPNDTTTEDSSQSIVVIFNDCEEFITEYGVDKYVTCIRNVTRLYYDKIVRLTTSSNEEPVLVKYTGNQLCYSFYHYDADYPLCQNQCKELKKHNFDYRNYNYCQEPMCATERNFLIVEFQEEINALKKSRINLIVLIIILTIVSLFGLLILCSIIKFITIKYNHRN